MAQAQEQAQIGPSDLAVVVGDCECDCRAVNHYDGVGHCGEGHGNEGGSTNDSGHKGMRPSFVRPLDSEHDPELDHGSVTVPDCPQSVFVVVVVVGGGDCVLPD